MKICIAGGGRVGRYLAQSLLANHHSVVIIEPIEAQCRMLADQLDIPVICGDSISMDILRTADAASCDAFVAVTGSDEDNLIACQLAKREFGVDRTVARASNPKNRELLHTLGVDTVVCGTDNLSHILEREIETDTIRQLLSLGGGTASLNEILLQAKPSWTFPSPATPSWSASPATPSSSSPTATPSCCRGTASCC